jgi:hypothetical protein
VKIHYSLNRSYYYISTGHSRFWPRDWLSVEATPGEVPAELRKGGFLEGYVQLTLKDGTTYYRKVLPFAFYKVKSGDVEDISVDNDLFIDYACTEKWDRKDLEIFFESTCHQELNVSM